MTQLLRRKGFFGYLIVLCVGLVVNIASTKAVEFGGYFDAQGNFNTTSSEGFTLKAGGLTARQVMGPWEGYIDFGLKNGVALETLKSQAYVQYDFGLLNIRLGQFDSPFRYNPVDSIDRVLVSESLTDSSNGLQLYTRLGGARVQAKLGPLTVSGYVVNPRNQPILGAGGTLDLGAVAAVDFGILKASSGILYNVDSALGWIWDTDAMVDLSFLKIAAGFIYKNSTSTTAWSGILEPSLVFSDRLEVAVRGEYLKPTASTYSLQVSAGPQFKFEKIFRMKAEYAAATSSTATLNHSVGIAALAAL